MKKILLIFPLLIIALSSLAQVQKGTVRLQSSGKKAVSGVQILYSDAKASESDAGGVFRLAFAGKKPGDLIFLERIHKSGYEVVNTKELEISKISSGDYLQKDIVLAIAGTLEAAKREYYQISDKALTASFEREKQTLKAQLQQVKLNQQEYLRKYDELQKQFDQQKKNLDALAEKFARTNFDDVSQFYKEALVLFKAGKVEDAIKKLEGANLMSEADKVIKEEKRLAVLQQELNEQKEKTQTQKKQTIQALELNADIYVLRYETAKAEAIYEALLRLDSTNLEIIQKVAEFYKTNHRYEKALQFYNKMIAFPNLEAYQLADAYLAIGQLYINLGKLKPEASEAIKKSFEFYEKMVAENENRHFQHRLALVHEAFGELRGEVLSLRLNNYKKMNQILKKLYLVDSTDITLKKDLARSYQKIGDNSMPRGYKSAFDIELAEVANTNQVDSTDAADVIASMVAGEIYKGAKQNFEMMQKLLGELFKAFPNNPEYKYNLALAYEKLGDFYINSREWNEAQVNYQKLHQMQKELYEAYPLKAEFKNAFAISYSKLASAYVGLNNLDQALSLHQQRNNLAKELSEAIPENVNFKYFYAISYLNLGYFYSDKDKYKAISNYQKGENLLKELIRDAPQYSTFQTTMRSLQEQINKVVNPSAWNNLADFSWIDANKFDTFVEGFIITKDSVKLEGSILYDDIRNIQKAITFKPKDGGKKRTYVASDGEIIAAEFAGDRFDLVSFKMRNATGIGLGGVKPRFLRREFRGDYITTYVHYEGVLGNETDIKAVRLLKKKTEEGILVTDFGWKKSLSNYFADYPELVERIEKIKLAPIDSEIKDLVYSYELYYLTKNLR
jgi:tetratricopeptide (TPR) repeat protein